MKQPREDVAGVQRTDDLLSLDMDAAPHRATIAALMRHLTRATMVGHPAPIVQRMCERIRDPQIGDLVVESHMATRHRADLDTRTKAVGYLLEHRTEWACTDAEWADAIAEDPGLADQRVTDEAWYVQYGPAPEDVCRWTNCSFLAVPVDPRAFDSGSS